MKKLFVILMSGMLLFGMTACGNTENTESIETVEMVEDAESVENTSVETTDVDEEIIQTEAAESVETEESESGESNAAVIYFSATGTTKGVAETLAEMQGADIYEIVPEQPYTDEDLNYNDSSTRATVEQNDDSARPAFSISAENIEEYDIIYVGFPIWWGDMPRILYTFFDTYDLSGKTIAPFATSGGSGISKAVQSIGDLEPDATVTDGLLVNTSDAETYFTEWLGGLR